MNKIRKWWNARHRHTWKGYGGGRACKVCQTCGEYRCEDGSWGMHPKGYLW